MENKIIPHNKLSELKAAIKGEVFADEYTRLIYATDASAYRQLPVLVVRPADVDDINIEETPLNKVIQEICESNGTRRTFELF